jgi:hypothetical protein
LVVVVGERVLVDCSVVVVGFSVVLATVFDTDEEDTTLDVVVGVGVVVNVDIGCNVRSQVRRRTGTTMAVAPLELEL